MARIPASTRLRVRDMGTSLLFGANASDKIDCGTDIIGTGDITITGWIKLESLGGGDAGRLLSNGNFQFLVAANRLFKLSSNGSTFITCSDDPAFDFGKWLFFSLVRTSAGLVTMRINGVQSGLGEHNSGTPVAGTTNLIIGNKSGSRVFDGNMDEIRVFNRILTTAEQDNLYYNGTVPSTLLAEYLFNEGSGTSANDSSGNGNDGVITGATYSSDVPISTRTVAGTRTTAGTRTAV